MIDSFINTNRSNMYLKQIHSLLNDCIFYVEAQENKGVLDYLKNNYKEIQALFKTKYKSFVIASDIEINDDLKEVVSYYYPRIDINSLDFSTGNNNQYLLELFGYNGKNGLLSIDNHISFTDLSSIKIEELKQYLTQYVENIYIEEFDDLPMSSSDDSDTNISIDDETQMIVNAIIDKFNILKKNGNFINVLPIIEDYIKENNYKNIEDLSPIFIDDDYRMYLTEYNNLEIKLSHLSKCVYLLFLNHDEGIHLKELANHKDELIEYYKRISYRIDYNKMLASVNDIVNTNTNAIYVHLSRIKSIFTRNLHPKIAQNYYILGGKNKPKRISINRDLVQWDELS